ncbi:metal ABC transporter ATP-binding protein [Tuanshanicoccus lijuaniae]|uniref:metal ABC transporter ATP-binding protein n=1 Tax=Aerococcaceae bacterium zg-1292 TaxID=2774330 RepID=UPI001BD88699|nr:metal ABC transporter ATP-binding protein [Aerococcaceae bacterium zg-BR22]MBS4456822.1 metal ABC transporter ATP-binding protein [Aerococcaceae bacterium zg-A91]MBS4458650.1 metal ABC transporter ATP-binding protein [Aerococcaceae bacterium zg-BR33]
MTHLLTIKNLAVSYQQTQALHDINLVLPTEQRIAIIGPNGAGKSTLMQAALHLIPYQADELLVLERPIREVRDQVAYVPQRANVNWHFPTTVLDVVQMGITSQRFGFQRIQPEQKERALFAIEKMALTDLQDRQINQLSGGQKQRVFLARAIAQDAQAYFLDEPLAGVDKTSEALIMEQLAQLKNEKRSSITVHHQLETVADYFDYVVLLNRTMIAAGPIHEVMTQENINLAYTGTAKTDWGHSNDKSMV